MHARRLASILLTTLILLPRLAQPADAPAEHTIELRLDALDVTNRKASQSGAEIRLDAAPGAGFAWIKGLDMNEGCLALDVKGSNEFGRSFVGIAFRALDADVYDTVYVRPFVFQSDKPEYVANGLQYMAMPEFGWPVLRERHPGVYEKSIGSRPGPEEWVHLEVRFGGGRVKAFVNRAREPQLDVPLLTSQTAGRVALWVGNNSSGAFRALRRCESAR
jgi:hypothetical protein